MLKPYDVIVLITRGLAEMTRIGTAYGASPLTFLTLAGVGDLFLTCSSSTSRNYTVGYRLGQGEKLDHIIETLGSVAEGVTTAKGLKVVIDELGVSAQIATGVSSCSPLLRNHWLTFPSRFTTSCMKVRATRSNHDRDSC